MDDFLPEGNGDAGIERPLDCFECKKPIAVRYTEVVGKTITHCVMCADCPHLERRLHGLSHLQKIEGTEALAGGLCCGNCGTTLESVRMGNLLGCSECYLVFSDILVQELATANRVSKSLLATKKGIPLHIGRSPGEKKEMSPSLRLLALNEALTETLKREDYEQAAWLRDQIKSLTEQQDGQK